MFFSLIFTGRIIISIAFFVCAYEHSSLYELWTFRHLWSFRHPSKEVGPAAVQFAKETCGTLAVEFLRSLQGAWKCSNNKVKDILKVLEVAVRLTLWPTHSNCKWLVGTSFGLGLDHDVCWKICIIVCNFQYGINAPSRHSADAGWRSWRCSGWITTCVVGDCFAGSACRLRGPGRSVEASRFSLHFRFIHRTPRCRPVAWLWNWKVCEQLKPVFPAL